MWDVKMKYVKLHQTNIYTFHSGRLRHHRRPWLCVRRGQRDHWYDYEERREWLVIFSNIHSLYVLV